MGQHLLNYRKKNTAIWRPRKHVAFELRHGHVVLVYHLANMAVQLLQFWFQLISVDYACSILCGMLRLNMSLPPTNLTDLGNFDDDSIALAYNFSNTKLIGCIFLFWLILDLGPFFSESYDYVFWQFDDVFF